MPRANLVIGPATFTVGAPTKPLYFTPSPSLSSGSSLLSIQSPTIKQKFNSAFTEAVISDQTPVEGQVFYGPPTPEQVNQALGISTGGTGTGAGGGGGGGGGGNNDGGASGGGCCGGCGPGRQIPCPFCLGQVLVKKGGRPFQRIAGFLQRSFSIKLPSTILKFLQENTPVSKQSMIKDKCPVCNNKRKIPDPSDDSAKWTAAASKFQSKTKEIEKLEAKLAPPCGNRYTVIQGSDLLEVGLGMNDVASYRVDKDCSVRNGRMSDLGSKEIDPKKGGPIPRGAKMNHVQGTNPPASPGGHYIIKCSNKFSLITGAQGIDITTGGPITINGGITQITGPEVTIGTQTGRLALEGQAVSIGGKSIEMAPTDGQVFVKGTLGATGNMVCGGHAHMESASVVNLETTGKNQESNISAPNNIYGGPAFWGGPIYEGLQGALKELKSFVLFNTTNPEHAKYIPSMRFMLGLGDNLQNLSYIMRPIEMVPTGICITPAGIGIVYNFPHIHAMPDQSHTHETRVPDIKCDADDAASLRGAQGGTAGPAPLHKSQTKLSSVLQEFWSVVSIPFAGMAATLQHFTYRK